MKKSKKKTPKKPAGQHLKVTSAQNPKHGAVSGAGNVPRASTSRENQPIQGIEKWTPGWMTSDKNKKAIKMSGKMVSCDPAKHPKKDDKMLYAMWIGQDDPKPAISGEHFWRFRVNSGDRVSFGLVTPEMTLDDFDGHETGIFYHSIRNVKIGGKNIINKYGPPIKPKDIIGVLLSFTKDRIQIYFYHNGNCLGLACSVYPHCYPKGLIPAVKFFFSPGSAEILQHLQPGDPDFPPPTNRDRVPQAEDLSSGIISGQWMALENSIKIDGKPFNTPVWGIRLEISKEWTQLNGGGRYTILLIANSATWFDVQWKRGDSKWKLVPDTLNYKKKIREPPRPDIKKKNLEQERIWMLWVYGEPWEERFLNNNPKWSDLDKVMKDWVVYPDQVQVQDVQGNHRVTIKKGNSMVSFQRPGVFEGDIKDVVPINVMLDY